jgi:uncharacterized protein YndB with AHSA1/START domain
MEKKEPFVIERIYPAPAERVWKAITNENEVRQWFVEFSGFKPEVGYEFTHKAFEGGVAMLLLFKIIEVVHGKRLSYSWRYEGYEGSSTVTIELFKEGASTKLRLTHAGLDTFPKLPAFAKENYSKGWTHFIGVSLPSFLETAV